MPSVNLEQQRKRAKDLRRAHARGDRDAAERIVRHLPRARGKPVDQVLGTPFTLSEAQLVVAREAGFASWPALRKALAPPEARSSDELIEAALRGDRSPDAARRVAAAVERALAAGAPAASQRVDAVSDDGISASSQPADALALAAAHGDAEAVAALLAVEPALADQRSGPRGWTPLLYACCVRGDATARVAIARRLLDAGADPNAVGQEPGYDSATEWRPIEGAAARVASLDLVELLLERGADLRPTTGLLVRTVESGGPAVLRRLLAAEPPWWQVIWALLRCSELDRRDAARLLVAAAARPSVCETALLDAIRRHRDLELVEILLGREPAPMWESAYRAAVRYGHIAARDALRDRGVGADILSPADRAIAACLAGEPAERPPALDERDHRMLAWAVQHAPHAVPRLLATGLDPNTVDADGNTPLHLAVRAGARATIDALLAGGAEIDARDYEARTPLDVALALPEPARERMARRLLAAGARPARLAGFRAAGDQLDDELRAGGAVERDDPDALFERAAHAVAFGDLATLRDLLDDEPALVHARSPRKHRATLLHYCAANGTESPRQRTPANAPAITELLLERGADPNATCRMYRGPDTTMGLLLTSAIPRAARLDGELVRVLARGGARVTRDELVAAILHDMPRSVAALVESGVPVDDLLLAAGANQLDRLRDLLDHGADPNTRFASGVTALHGAAAMGHLDAIRLLLERGADRTLRDHGWDNTPAGWAAHFEHADAVALLTADDAASPAAR
jgi:ankyrin repeat protein